MTSEQEHDYIAKAIVEALLMADQVHYLSCNDHAACHQRDVADQMRIMWRRNQALGSIVLQTGLDD